MRFKPVRLRQASLAVRVTALMGSIFIAFVLILGFAVQRSIMKHFAEQDADELQVVAAAVQQAISAEANTRISGDFQERMKGAVSGHHGIFFSVFDSTGQQLYAAPGPDLSRVLSAVTPGSQVFSEGLYRWSEGGDTYRGTVLTAESGLDGTYPNLVIVVASSMKFHLDFMAKFQKTLWGILAGATLIILAATWAAVQIGHKPLHRISEQIGNITTEKLNQRIYPGDVPVDLLELVNSFNDMLERMEDVFQRLSNFSADIAHELRTPITNLTTQTQVVLGKPRDVDEYREILYSDLEEFERMARMINDMLWLARSDTGLNKPAFEILDTAVEVADLIEYMGAWAEERCVGLKVEGQSPKIYGDSAMFRRALSNLLTNAIRHTDQNAPIIVRLDRLKDSAVIAIVNVGDDIPADHLSNIFDRFYRVDPSRQREGTGTGSGTGLGLSIAQSIIEAHGGAISVSSTNRHTEFRITLPIAGSH